MLPVGARNGQGTAVRDFYCHGCGRRLLQYQPSGLGAQAFIRVRCRDCKTTSELRGADVAALLHAIAHGKGE